MIEEDFFCDICKKKHPFYLRISSNESSLLYNIPEQEREKRVRVYYGGMFYQIDNENLIVKASLRIKIIDMNKYMHWELWVQINREEFGKMTQNLGGENSFIEGKLFENILYYKDTKGINVKLTFNLNNKDLNNKDLENPETEILDEESEIGKDYLNGIPEKKYMKWMQNMHH